MQEDNKLEDQENLLFLSEGAEAPRQGSSVHQAAATATRCVQDRAVDYRKIQYPRLRWRESEGGRRSTQIGQQGSKEGRGTRAELAEGKVSEKRDKKWQE